MPFASAAEHPDPSERSAIVPLECGAGAKSEIVASRRGKRAERKISALGEMTGGIAHDFRNILCVITSGLNVVERHFSDASKTGPALAVVHEGIERGMRMIDRLLAFSKQEERETGPEDVNALLAKLQLFLKYGAGPGIRVVLELAPELPDCLVDPPQFNSAILNLVVNARDAMPAGGVIRIATTASPSKADVEYVRVRVRDTGTGMPPEVRERIFDPYFTTKGEGGTGLGVPRVQALMRQVGGYVTVDSTVGKGTSFDLFFPVHEEGLAIAPDVGRQLDRWADEGGAIPAPMGAA